MAREIWLDTFAGVIPQGRWFARLEAGEKHGLRIFLDGENRRFCLDFGNVAGFQMLDEGTDLNCPEGYEPDESFWRINRDHNPSTLYEIQNGWYSKLLRQLMGPVLFDSYALREYRVVTYNYVIFVVTRNVPEIREVTV